MEKKETTESKTTKTTKTTKMSLVAKLAELQKQVRGLGKDAQNGQYDYVSGSKVLNVIRPAMDELGILLSQEVKDVTATRQDYQLGNGKVKSEMFIVAHLLFTWIDSESGETLPCDFFATGQNGWDKGIGSALTYGERYFLLKFFHIATDEDDVDRPQERDKEVNSPIMPFTARTEGTKQDEKYWQVVTAEAKGMTSKAGKSYRDEFIARYHPTCVELATFDDDVQRVRVANMGA